MPEIYFALYDNTKSKEHLGIQYKCLNKCVSEAVLSLIHYGFIPDKISPPARKTGERKPVESGSEKK